MSSSSHNKNEELYVNIQSPDNRKRFTIYNENDNSSIVLMVPNNLKYSSLLGLIINKFQLDPIVRNKLRVKAECGTRIKKLDYTFNNQVLKVSISDIVDEDPEEEEEVEGKEKSSNNSGNKELSSTPKENHLSLYKNEKENKNIFYKAIIKRIIKEPHENCRLIIGESYPYRIKILISDPKIRSRVYLYFTEIPNAQHALDYEFKLIIDQHPRDSMDFVYLENLIKKEISTCKSNIKSILSVTCQYYINRTTIYQPTTVQTSTNVLFSDLIQAETQSQNTLLSMIYDDIFNVSRYNNITESLAKRLLFNNNFNSKILLKGDKTQNHKSIISNNAPFKNSNIALFKFNNNNKQVAEENQEECSICYCDYSSNEMVELICGHQFCKNCLKSYFQNSIYDGNGNKISISCPSLSCPNKCIDEVTIETLVQDSSLIKTNIKNLVKDYVFHVSGTFMCPSNNCGRVLLGIRSTSKYSPYVHCGNHDFCIFCKKSGLHWPSSCINFKPKISDDLYSYKWILENTCVCPKCNNPVERNQGCSHMTCKCHYEFCYSCGSDWKNHSACGGASEKMRKNFNSIKRKNKGISEKFLSDFFKSSHLRPNNLDHVLSHLFETFLNLLSEGEESNKSIIENAIFSLKNYSDSSKEEKLASNCQKVLKKLLRPDITLKMNFGSNFFNKYEQDQNQPSIRSLSVNICINGQKKSLFKLFVNTQFFDFKQEISNQLNKYIQSQNQDKVELYDAKKLRIFNLYGGQIKNSNEILDSEALFITKSMNEPFIEPVIPTLTPEEIEKANQEIAKEKENEVELLINNTTKLFTKLQQKNKRRQDKSKLLENEVNQLKLQEQLKLDHQNNNIENNNNNNNSNHYQFYYKSNINNEEDQYYRNYDYSDEDNIIDECQDNNNNNSINSNDLTSYSSISEDEMFDFVNIDTDNSSSDFDSELEDSIKDIQVEKEQKEIEMIMKILEIFKDEQVNGDLDFEKAYSVCHSAKNLSHAISLMNKYLDETVYQHQYKFNQNHILMKEILLDYYPNVSQSILDRALLCTNYNLDKAKIWVFNKYLKQEEKKQAKQLKSIEKEKDIYKQNNIPTQHQISPKQQLQQDYYDDQDDYDDYEEYEDYLSSNLHSRFGKFNNNK